MDIFIFILAIVSLFVRLSMSKKAKQRAQQNAEQRSTAGSASTQPPNAAARANAPIFTANGSVKAGQTAAPSLFEAIGQKLELDETAPFKPSAAPDFAEGSPYHTKAPVQKASAQPAERHSLNETEIEKALRKSHGEGDSAYKDAALYEPQTSLGGAHAHEETSISGIVEECEPTLHEVLDDSPDRYGIAELSESGKFSPIVQGVIFAEIIGKPKALRG